MNKRKKLVIISHTEHYLNDANQIVGWGATINEINFLADYWEEVVHVGCFYTSRAPASALPYTKRNINFEKIPPYGGKGLINKIKILSVLPKIIKIVIQNIRGATEVQLRLPTSVGVFLLPLFSFIFPRNYTFWVKYAGNWTQENPPLSYRFQRWWLKKNFAKCKVTINGFWKNQPLHCISFENPCLKESQIIEGIETSKNKQFNSPFTFVFVGRLEDAKGVSTVIESFKSIPEEKIKQIHFIGDGKGMENYKKEAIFLKEKITFHGTCSSEKVHQLIRGSHFLLLPSKSEGFPKVIAEAACYGTIPIVSNVGSISHYINDKNGFLWNAKSNQLYSEILKKAIHIDFYDQKERIDNCTQLAKKFTFNNYLKALETHIFSKKNNGK